MFDRILRFSIRYRHGVLLVTALFASLGLLSYRMLIIDAVPDITNVQVQINSEAPGYSPYEVEQRITQPVEQILAGTPDLESIRSLSRYGLSQLTAVFRDGTDIYFARQLISQRLQESQNKLPTGISPTMGPIATGLGEIFHFIVENSQETSAPKTLQELREIQDWVVRPQLRNVPGVVDVNSIGGASKQIVISPDVDKLRAHSLTLDDVTRAIAKNNQNSGAGFVEHNGGQFILRVPANLERPSQLGDIPLAVHEGVPVQLSHVAAVEVGSELRTGAATEDGHEVVLGTVFMLMGENGRAVSERVADKLKEIAKSVPQGVIVKPVYNRAGLVNAAIATVRTNLLEGALLVVLILFLVLGDIRAAFITACVIPLSMAVTIFGMTQGRLSANLMSLGALDFGLIVDGAVILVENCVRRLRLAHQELGRDLTEEERLELVFAASSEVRQATLFGELIIMIVYVPILALSGIEGKMFHPMALTVLLALAAAFVLSLTFVPAAVAVVMRGAIREHVDIIGRIVTSYEAILRVLIRVPGRVLGVVGAIFIGSLALFPYLGAEFVPSLDEGDIALHALRIPGTSLAQSIDMQHQLERAIKVVPEVKEVFAKIGTAEIATDPMPPSVADGFVILKPRHEWPDPDRSKSDVVEAVERVAKSIPGSNYEFTQPIQMRFNELIAGVRADVALKVFGDDISVLFEHAARIEALFARIAGASDVKVEQVSGLPMLSVEPDREALGRFGLDLSDLQDALRTAYAGQVVGRWYEGDRNFPIVVRLHDKDRADIGAIGDLPIALPAESSDSSLGMANERVSLKPEVPHKKYVTVGQVATITLVNGPNQITRESGKRRVVVTANVRDRDLASFVKEAQERIASEIKLPPGYWLGWGGQYEHLLAAETRLLIVVPLVLLVVFLLVYATFRSVWYALVVYSGVPLALSGGIIALWLRSIPFSISAAVGFIALSGVSVLNGLVLVSFTRKLLKECQDPVEAIVEGAKRRLHAVLMTALVASLGFVPMALSQGTGAEVQKPLATVVIGGIISSTSLTLLVLPILLSLMRVRSRR